MSVVVSGSLFQHNGGCANVIAVVDKQELKISPARWAARDKVCEYGMNERVSRLDPSVGKTGLRGCAGRGYDVADAQSCRAVYKQYDGRK